MRQKILSVRIVIEGLSPLSPVRHKGLQPGVKLSGVVWMEKMNQLMENHIFNTGQRRLHQLPGKGNPPGARRTAPPTGCHGTNSDFRHRNSQMRHRWLNGTAEGRRHRETQGFQESLHNPFPQGGILRFFHRQDNLCFLLTDRIFLPCPTPTPSSTSSRG